MDNRSAFGHLAAILRKAQGRIDAETDKEIDVGYECAKLREQFDALWAEVEQLRRMAEDARRYRWLRDQELPDVMDLWHQHPDRVDAAIDAAMEASNAG